jgi:hypothetical protein
MGLRAFFKKGFLGALWPTTGLLFSVLVFSAPHFLKMGAQAIAGENGSSKN